MVPENFKENGFMIGLGLFIVVFVIAQSLFFLVKAWKQGKKLGITTDTLKNTVVSSALFTIAPAISILATVIVLANSLGIVLPWIRLSVIGNLAYESVAAEAALDTFGLTLSSPVTDPKVFATIAFVMTIGCILPLILIIFVMKKVQKTMGKVADKNSKLADTLSAAALSASSPRSSRAQLPAQARRATTPSTVRSSATAQDSCLCACSSPR